MADQPAVHIGENSAEEIAYKLMLLIAHAEKKTLWGPAPDNGTAADRRWILDTYQQCIETEKNT